MALLVPVNCQLKNAAQPTVYIAAGGLVPLIIIIIIIIIIIMLKIEWGVSVKMQNKVHTYKITHLGKWQ